jgi:UDP-N-acetylmuramate dehydrogenase
MTTSPSINIQRNISLAPLCTIKLGGAASHFTLCQSVSELREALTYAAEHRLRVHVLGGGSNVVFADEGFDGLVVKVGVKGISSVEDGGSILVTAAAGEEWDSFVAHCISRGLAGVECLSGIPGHVGATPIQNVGAYGQEVRETIVSVQVHRSR